MPRKTNPTVDEKPVEDVIEEVADAPEAGDGLPESEPTDDIGTLEGLPTEAEDESPAEDAPKEKKATPKAEVTSGRVFKIGSTKIFESDATVGKSNEAVRQMLKDSYPEVANATIGVTSEGDQVVVSFLPQPGRKG